jgi:uncharacterized repeat protein (TIGR01451 family)
VPRLERLEDRIAPTFSLGAAANYAILYEGGGGNTLHIANSTTNTAGTGAGQGGGIGNIGVGGTGAVQVTGGGANVNGNVDFAGAANFSGTSPTGTVNSNVAAVTNALNTVNALNTTLGALPGTNVAINGNTTINASAGTFSASGTGYTNVRVFNVTSFSLGHGQTLTINGDANGDSVVLNFTSGVNFNGNVALTGGLTPDDVIFNFVGGSNLTGGPSLSFNNGNASDQSDLAQGIFLNPNGTVSSNPSNILGRIFGGDSAEFQFNGGSNITAPGGGATPTITTIPIPTAVTLATNSVTLKDTATLSGATSPTGTITFFLFYNGGSTPVHTETVSVSGDGPYTTPTGFTLPTDASTVTGTYEWDAFYSGSAGNDTAADFSDPNEQVTVNPAAPTLVTTASPNVTLPTAPPGTVTLSDSAVLSGGYFPGGNIVFTLTGPGGFMYSQTDTVSGNGTYTASTTLPTTGTVAGTYTWSATYEGDGNNNSFTETGNAANGEQTVVSPARPTLTTTPNPTTVTLSATAPPILTDSATLSGGYHPTGTITFELFQNGGSTAVDTETVAVNGNATYTTPTGFTLPTSGPVAGNYQWVAIYSGDNNNSKVSDSNPAAEQVTVNPANPSLTTSPNLTTVTLGATAPPILTDTATLSGGFDPTGNITFELFQGSTLLHTEIVAVNSNGSYTTPTGFTLPATGAVAGAYQWVAVYSGDDNNAEVIDSNPAAEQVTVNPASPTLGTTASPTTVTLPVPVSTILTDTAVLSGGFNPTGNIVFTLSGPGGFVYTQTDTVNGNGTYTASTTLPTTGTVAGTYTWTATYEGDDNNNAANDQGGTAEQTVVGSATLSLVTLATPLVTVLPFGPPGTVTLRDAAFLSGGQSPTGSIIFTLTGPGGFMYTQTDRVNGNGTYTASTTLPNTGTVAGTYTWTARYSGDGNNKAANDQGGIAEQTVVRPAKPTLVTIASPLVKTLPTAPPGMVTLSDSAFLLGGYFPTGNIVFTLTGPGGFMYTQTDTVNGNGTYTASTTLPTTGTVAGTYTWTVHYRGDVNNNAADDNGLLAEQTVVRPTSPTLVTTASPALRRGAAPSTLTDEAVLSGGYFPTGTITFTLTGPGGFFFTEDVTVSGNGTYTASTPLPTTGTVAGTYTWSAIYKGDDNNNEAIDQGGTAEQVTVAPASPTLVTTASPDITLGTAAPTLSDSAELEGGFNPTGDIVFTLTGPGGFSYIQTDRVNGNGIYTASTPLPTTGTVAGVYTWSVSYEGDVNNNAAIDQGGPDEQTVVSPASPTIVTIASPSTAMFGATLQDVAVLTGGYFPTGTITFKLYAPGVDPTVGSPVFTTVMGVSGDGTYHTPLGFVANASGIWHWVATYNGDPNNNSVSSGPLEEPVTISPAADVSLTKLVNQTTPIFGTPVTYTLIAHNNGPDTATGVVATDVLPAGLVFVSATASQGSFDAGSGQWTIGTLPNGATATLQITGIVATIGPITNSASVGALQFDPDPANNVSSATIEGMLSAGQVSKSLFLSSSDAPLNPAMVAAEEALFNALVPMWTNLWDALLSVEQNMLAAGSGPGNGGVPVFEGDWLGSPLVVYANPFASQVTAVQVGTFDFLYENNTVAGVRLI